MIEQFHFIRPFWLLALLPLLIVCWFLFKQTVLSRSWQSVIDPVLLPHLLNQNSINKPRKSPLIIFFIAALAGIFSLAGPTWEKRPQPLFKQDSALVILLDLSRSMDANDIKPSRLIRARLKISDLLSQRKEGQTALIAYAANAFTVTPLTDDTATIKSLLSSLSTDIMPAQGSHADEAIKKATGLLSNAGIAHGDILLVTDSADADSFDAAQTAVKKGHRISVLAVGTKDGAPIPLDDGGFLKNTQGDIVIPRLDVSSLQKLSQMGHGRFSLMRNDDSDIQYLQALFMAKKLKDKSIDSQLKTDLWQEQGYWLLVLLIPLALLAFRRGYLALLIFFILPIPKQADALTWDDLWLNNNQRAEKALHNNNAKQAAELFKDPQWKGSAEYKAGDYEQAAKYFSQNKSAEGFYNLGNSLAKSKKIPQAIKAYQQALKLNPKHADAKYNKELLEKQQKDNKKSDKNSDKDNKDNKDNKDSKKSPQNKQDKNSKKSSKQQNNNQPEKNKTNKSEPNAEKDNSSQQDKQDKQDKKNNAQKTKQQKQAAKKAQQDAQKNKKESASDDLKQPSLSEQAAQQWLRRIPDDPGGLLRNKFKYQYKRQGYQSDEDKNW